MTVPLGGGKGGGVPLFGNGREPDWTVAVAEAVDEPPSLSVAVCVAA